MEHRRVWTKQHVQVLAELEESGRYTVKRKYVELENGDCAPIVLEAYDWLAGHAPNREFRPADAEYPVWVSLDRSAAMLPEPGRVLLELEVDPAQLAFIPVGKWGMILNYSYIPASPADKERHRRLLADYGISDAAAYMSRFYPDVKREIVSSWDRLLDERIQLGGSHQYGILWELRKEWIVDVVR